MLQSSDRAITESKLAEREPTRNKHSQTTVNLHLCTQDQDGQTETEFPKSERDGRRALLDDPTEGGNDRFVERMQKLRHLMKIQSRAVRAQIDARQKRRQAGFKRRDVWFRDSLFMKELQRLIAQQELNGFPELVKLAEECQLARDNLGPLEEEGTEAEQRMERELWNLQQAEESVYDNFMQQFQPADAGLHGESSSATSESDSDTEGDSLITQKNGTFENGLEGISLDDITPMSVLQELPDVPYAAALDLNPRQESTLLGIHHHNVASADSGEIEWGSDSGLGDIDRSPELWTTNGMLGLPQLLPQPRKAVFQRYPELVADSGTRRSRINKWLLNTALLSPLEANILMDQLKYAKGTIPSNWSQLVLAYWELDEAAVPPQTVLGESPPTTGQESKNIESKHDAVPFLDFNRE